jgi:hypothetical protein
MVYKRGMDKPHSIRVTDGRPSLVMGQVVMTRGVGALELDLKPVLNRFCFMDFGDICEEDAQVNQEALKHDARLMGVYKVQGHTLWIIREAVSPEGEWDTLTTVLLPEEY